MSNQNLYSLSSIMNREKEKISTPESAVQSENINAHVEEYLNYYCSLEYGPGFAVLLKGKWGVGKTWFIRNYFDKSDGKWGKPIYVSLYGVSKTSQIKEKLFEALHPLFASKPAKLVGLVARGLIKTTIQVDLNQDSKNDGSYSLQIPEINLPSYLDNVEKRVLIFDDLERCKLDVDSVLGYINTFVEEQRSKVIILANEEEVNGKYRASEEAVDDKYRGVKEKVVGQTLTVRFDLHGAIKPFSSAITAEKARQSLIANAAIIEEIYAKADYENLRSLKQIMFNFERIFNALPSEAQIAQGIIEDLIRSLTALSIEVQKGDLLPKEIGDLVKQSAQRRVARNTSSKTKGEEASKTTGLAFLEKYNLFFSHALFPNESWWQRFFDEGILDIEGLKSAFESSVYFQNANMPDWKKLWYFSHLTDEEFSEILPRVALDFENQIFENIQVVKHVFGTLLNLSYNQLYAETPGRLLAKGKAYTAAFIDQAYADGLSDLYASAELSVELLAYGYMGSFGLAYQGSDYEEYKAFEAYALEYGEVVRQSYLSLVADELLTLMESDRWKFKRALCLDQYNTNDVKNYYNVPILNFVDVDKFIAILINLRRIEDTSLVGYTLKERYSSSNHGLEKELDWLRTLKDKLANEINSREKTIVGYRLIRFKTEYIDPVVQNIEDSLSNDSTSQ